MQPLNVDGLEHPMTMDVLQELSVLGNFIRVKRHQSGLKRAVRFDRLNWNGHVCSAEAALM
jgi:hypothetical protein